MKLKLHRGSTHKLIHVFIQDSTATDGSGLAGLTSASGGLTCYYFIEGATSAVVIALSAGTLGTWSAGGFVAVDGTHMPGLYELGLPDLMLASGNSVKLILKGATSMVVCPVEIELDAVNYQDSAAAGLTTIPTIATGVASLQTGVTLLPGQTVPALTMTIISATTTQIVADLVSGTLPAQCNYRLAQFSVPITDSNIGVERRFITTCVRTSNTRLTLTFGETVNGQAYDPYSGSATAGGIGILW